MKTRWRGPGCRRHLLNIIVDTHRREGFTASDSERRNFSVHDDGATEGLVISIHQVVLCTQSVMLERVAAAEKYSRAIHQHLASSHSKLLSIQRLPSCQKNRFKPIHNKQLADLFLHRPQHTSTSVSWRNLYSFDFNNQQQPLIKIWGEKSCLRWLFRETPRRETAKLVEGIKNHVKKIEFRSIKHWTSSTHKKRQYIHLRIYTYISTCVWLDEKAPRGSFRDTMRIDVFLLSIVVYYYG